MIFNIGDLELTVIGNETKKVFEELKFNLEFLVEYVGDEYGEILDVMISYLDKYMYKYGEQFNKQTEYGIKILYMLLASIHPEIFEVSDEYCVKIAFKFIDSVITNEVDCER